MIPRREVWKGKWKGESHASWELCTWASRNIAVFIPYHCER